mgnify:CR=1 FL=1
MSVMVEWNLMEDAITFRDRMKMAWFLLTSDRLTNGSKVREFEKQWSEWLGVDYSLYVSSGSTANSLLVSAVKELYNLQDGDKVLVPATTWMTNVAPLIQNNLEPIFCDINLNNFSFDIEEAKYIATQHDIKAVFVTHLIGLSSDVEYITDIFPNAIIMEDVCESHGVTDPSGKKRGTQYTGGTFSFYFGHHMTTIEGGMVSTNDINLYNLMKMKRSHGMAREALPEKFELYKTQNPEIDPAFLFMTDGYNFRNHEICAVLGLSQLKRLSKNIQIRRENFDYYYQRLKDMDQFYLPQYQFGNSSFSFPIISKNGNIEKLKGMLKENKIEYRPIISGNLLRHPAFSKYELCTEREVSNVEILHTQGLYVGNSQFVTKKQIDHLFNILGEYVKF